MVFVAQSGERRFVEPRVVGSKPTIHPTYPRSSMERTCGYGPQDGSSNLSEDTKDDTKRRMTDVERRVARVHTKDKNNTRLSNGV